VGITTNFETQFRGGIAPTKEQLPAHSDVVRKLKILPFAKQPFFDENQRRSDHWRIEARNRRTSRDSARFFHKKHTPALIPTLKFHTNPIRRK
jgi:hypothetical protein